MKHGIEQELQIIDPEKLSLIHNRIDEVVEKIRGWYRRSTFQDFGPDAYTSQLEYWIGVFDDLLLLGKKITDFRRIACESVEELELSLMACGVNPISATEKVGENFGEHHHIGVDSAKEALLLHNLIRIFIPELIALSANSRFYDGKDTKFASFRLHRSPHCQLPPLLTQFDELKIRWLSHASDPGKERWWDVTPFVKSGRQTVEVRLFDVTPSCKRSLTYACLLQGLYTKLKNDVKLEQFLTTSIPEFEKILDVNRAAAIQKGISAKFERMAHPIDFFVQDDKINAVDAVYQLEDWLHRDLNRLPEPLLIEILSAELKEWSDDPMAFDSTTALNYAHHFHALTAIQSQNVIALNTASPTSKPLNIGRAYCLDDGLALKNSKTCSEVLECQVCGRLHPSENKHRKMAYNAIAVDTLSCHCGSPRFASKRGDLWQCKSCGNHRFVSFYENIARIKLRREITYWLPKGHVRLSQSDSTIKRLTVSRTNPNQLGLLTNDGRFILCKIDPFKGLTNEISLHTFDQAEDVKATADGHFMVINPYALDPVCVYDRRGLMVRPMVRGRILPDCGYIRLVIDAVDTVIAIGINRSGCLQLLGKNAGGTEEHILDIGCEDILASTSTSLGCGNDIMLLTRREGVFCIHRKTKQVIWDTPKTGDWKDIAVHPRLYYTTVTDFEGRRVLFIETGGRISDHCLQLEYTPFAIDFSSDGNMLYISEFGRPVLHFYQRQTCKKGIDARRLDKDKG